MKRDLGSVGELSAKLASIDYLASDDLATAAWLAVSLRRPLLLEGEPGTGKTALAEALARILDLPLIRLQCHEGIDTSQALYEWDFQRQLLHLKAIEADVSEPEDLYSERFLLDRPLLRAVRQAPAVLLIDEIDRADDEFEAFLLELLADFRITVPELGEVVASEPPVVVLTSNRTRELHDALRRRCLYHWIDHPSPELERAIVLARLPEVEEQLARQVVEMVTAVRASGPAKPPGVSETIDWARTLLALGGVSREGVDRSIGALMKSREDLMLGREAARAALDAM